MLRMHSWKKRAFSGSALSGVTTVCFIWRMVWTGYILPVQDTFIIAWSGCWYSKRINCVMIKPGYQRNSVKFNCMSTFKQQVTSKSPFRRALMYWIDQCNKCSINTIVKKVKESRNKPSVAQRVPGGLGSQISWHSAHEGGEVLSLTHWPPLPPGMFLVLIFTRGWVDPRAKVRSEGSMSLKNPVTPPEIDPGTVRLVAQRLNH